VADNNDSGYQLKLTDEEILGRIDYMDRWIKRFRDADTVASCRYIDANDETTGYDEDRDTDWYEDQTEEAQVPDEIPVGQPNYLAINNETKMAAIAMGVPALHVKANEDPQLGGIENAGEIVAKTWEQSWDNGNWGRDTNAGLQKLGICGLGMIWYRWDEVYGPCIEHVPSKRLLIDPHATNLLQMEMGGVKVRMSLRKALRLYDPNGENEYFTSITSSIDTSEAVSNDRTTVTIAIYFDREREVHAYNDKIVFQDENLYGKVPLIPIEGFIDPRDKLLPLGDNVFAAGLNQQVVDLAAIASSTAKHGGPITFLDPNAFEEETKTAYQEGQHQGPIFIKGMLNPQAPPFLEKPASQLSPAFGVARQEAQSALDGIQGSSPGMRGQMIPGVTATQAQAVEAKAGARPAQSRAAYETWITRIARAYVFMMQKFGGPTEKDPGTTDTVNIWKAFKAVYEVRVIEGSSAFNNPAHDEQAAMQKLTTISMQMPLALQLHAQGFIEELPNWKMYVDDMLYAFGCQNHEQYWLKVGSVQQQQGPSKELVQALVHLYSQAPPDVRREIEKAIGLQPSQESEQSVAPGKSWHETMSDHVLQGKQHAHEVLMKQLEHEHRMRELGAHAVVDASKQPIGTAAGNGAA
jgi:hypothetical protein